MKTLLVSVALGLMVSLSGALAFADQQTTAAQADNALNWAAVGGRGALHGARAEFVHHRRYRDAYDMIDPPAGSGGGHFVYGPGRAPYASEGGPALDFQLQGR
jgi:hypothetical protein